MPGKIIDSYDHVPVTKEACELADIIALPSLGLIKLSLIQFSGLGGTCYPRSEQV